MRLHVFTGESAILKFQACPKHSPLCQSCNSSSGQLAVRLSQSGLSYPYDGPRPGSQKAIYNVRLCMSLMSYTVCSGFTACTQFTDCVQTYKFVHTKYKTAISVYFKKPARELSGHTQKLMKQYSRTEIRNNFFSNRVIDTWNTLRDTTVQDQSMASMKQKSRADL